VKGKKTVERVKLETVIRGLTTTMMRPLASSRVTPNELTIAGLLLNGVTAAAIGGGYLFASGLLLLFAGLFDMADGALARVKNAASPYGDFLDATLDRLAEGSVGFGLLLHALAKHNELQSGLVYAFVIGSVLISYARARAEVLNLECEVGLMARPQRIILLAAGLLAAQLTKEASITVTLVVLSIATYVTVIQRIVHVYRATRGAARG
jgi:CDP-diacylglycerol--glycerol-3-phosphate 3-phosphatidyltransferase